MAGFNLNRQIRKQYTSFQHGLYNVVVVQWLYMFGNKEFQVLISGAEIPVDIGDSRKNAKYSGDFEPNHSTIVLFWDVLKSFSNIQRRQLLEFVTSCSRPPLLDSKVIIFWFFEKFINTFYVNLITLSFSIGLGSTVYTDRVPSAKLLAFNSKEQMRSDGSEQNLLKHFFVFPFFFIVFTLKSL